MATGIHEIGVKLIIIFVTLFIKDAYIYKYVGLLIRNKYFDIKNIWLDNYIHTKTYF